MARRRGMFYEPPHHTRLAEIITFKSVSGAREACRELTRMFDRADRNYKVIIKKAVVLARNRAVAMQRKHDLTMKERRKLQDIADVYEKCYKEKMILPRKPRTRRWW